MINRLLEHYPTAYTSKTPIQTKGTICFWLEDGQQYIGIPIEDLTPEETELLKSLFPTFHEETTLNDTYQEKRWYDFLLNNEKEAKMPASIENGVFRIIQFAVSKKGINIQDLKEALKNMFAFDVTVIFLNDYHGFIVEEKQQLNTTEDDFHASLLAFENDFYVPISLYIGEFKNVYKLKNFFQYEQKLFQFARSHISASLLFTLKNILPVYLIHTLPIEIRKQLFMSIFDVFRDDRELWKTVKKYLENYTNTSLTSKQLFIHRNSLQYRIEKFEEKTNLNLKMFTDAMFAYYACLDFEYIDEN
ncbi:MAG: PucR family transcriptional regulator [Bacillus sp. (in: Bacteria)]|nr:PucR family transcriptional regulator [Bacillus sp. (in: firmicutes)]